jgi:hypothetical protein
LSRRTPIPAVGVIEVKRVKSTLLGYSGFVLGMTAREGTGVVLRKPPGKEPAGS